MFTLFAVCLCLFIVGETMIHMVENDLLIFYKEWAMLIFGGFCILARVCGIIAGTALLLGIAKLVL